MNIQTYEKNGRTFMTSMSQAAEQTRMRERKFRAWDKNRNCFLIPDYTLLDLTTKHYNFDKNLIWIEFTGLKDIEGKEIYEGDIIRLDCGNEKKYIVEYITDEGEHRCGFFLRRIEDNEIYEFGSFNVGIKIIGNKFKNPKLLK